MDKWFHPTLYWGCNYLSILGFKLIHVSKRGHGCLGAISGGIITRWHGASPLTSPNFLPKGLCSSYWGALKRLTSVIKVYAGNKIVTKETSTILTHNIRLFYTFVGLNYGVWFYIHDCLKHTNLLFCMYVTLLCRPPTSMTHLWRFEPYLAIIMLLVKGYISFFTSANIGAVTFAHRRLASRHLWPILIWRGFAQCQIMHISIKPDNSYEPPNKIG